MRIFELIFKLFLSSLFAKCTMNNSTIDTDSNIINLNSLNFDSNYELHNNLLVYFYLPDCEKCQKFDQIYLQALNISISENLNVAFSRIDAFNNKKIIEIHKILKYPSLILFRNVGRDMISFKDKNKTVDSLLKFVRNGINTNFLFERVQTEDELMSLIDKRNIIIFTGDNDRYKNELIITKRAVDNLGKKFRLILINSNEFKTKYHLHDDKLELLFFKKKKVGNDTLPIQPIKMDISLIDRFETNNLIRLFGSYSRKPFTELNYKTLEIVLDGTIDSLIIILDKDNKSNNSRLLESIKGLAEKNIVSLWTLIGSYGDERINELMEIVTILKSDLPCAIILSGINNKTDVINRYKYITNERGLLNEENLRMFVNEWKEGKLNYILESEPLPNVTVNEFGVHRLVTNNLNNFLHKEPFSIVLFINNQMQNYQHIRQRLSHISERLKTINIIVGEIDPYRNEIDVILLKNYPGIALFSNVDNKIDSHEYDERGGFNSINILTFIKNSTNINVFNLYTEIEKLELERESLLIQEKMDEEDHDLSEYLKGVNSREMIDSQEDHLHADNENGEEDLDQYERNEDIIKQDL